MVELSKSSGAPRRTVSAAASWVAVEEGADDATVNSDGMHRTWEESRSIAKRVAPKFNRKIGKILCANRGEIAIRVFRAAHELGLHTVAIYSYEDRLSLHRYRADESFLVGKGKAPIEAYLDHEDIIRIAQENKVDAIHPGYGFLSENAVFARKVNEAGIIFIGPNPDVIRKLGDKTAAREVAIEAKVPIVPGTKGPASKLEDVETFVKQYGFPVIIKAAFGGGGRGMRVVKSQDKLAEAFKRATSEALSSFGDGTVFVERFLHHPRHIEVQIVADETGNVVHCFERDCSVQRRHQKVVEIAPAQNLKESIRDQILEYAISIGRTVGYTNAGTVEFLVDEQDRPYFIEVNPRIQVEHTITESITGLDLVQAQICIAGGVTLKELNMMQEEISCRGCSIQLRITTEDPTKDFQPDTGRIDVYRSSGGNGIRLDGCCAAGQIISPHYDSLLVKVIGFALGFEKTVIRLLRALTEFRVRGVKTNILFLQRLLTHPEFLQRHGVYTSFIDENPDLFKFVPYSNRATKLLKFLGDLAVNGLELPCPVEEEVPPQPAVPELSKCLLQNQSASTPPTGWRDILLRDGPASFAKAVRQHNGLLITDTTWRDAHQSLLATRVRSVELTKIARCTSYALAKAFSLEMWGGATFDVCMRFLHEDPWKRLDALRALVPNIPFQMLLRGANAVGYTSYPDNVVYEFVRLAKLHGIDIFRVFDSLNYVENLELGIDAVRKAGGVIEACLCYTGDVSDPSRTKFNVSYYVDLARRLVSLGIHILAIKDMAGLLKPEAARILISTLRKEFPDLPIHVHTHDTAGTGVASMMAAARAGADVVDLASDSLSGLTSQPSLGAFVSSVAGTEFDTGIDLDRFYPLNDYWEQARKLYQGFESPSLRSGNSDVYVHEMPGGQYTNLQFQAFKLGLGSQWRAIKAAYAVANKLCGDIVKVTPSSKVVGDFAQFLVQNQLDEAAVIAQAKTLSFPQSVVQYFQGYLGQPPGGFPEQLRRDIVRNLAPINERPGKVMPPADLAALRKQLFEKFQCEISETEVISAALYPQVFDEYMSFKREYGDISILQTTLVYFKPQIGVEYTLELNKGKLLYVSMLTIGQPLPSGEREVYWTLNGDARVVRIKDRHASVDSRVRERAEEGNPSSVGAPMSGVVVDIRIEQGAVVKAGDPIAVLSAMKMETIVTAPVGGSIGKVAVTIGDSLAAGDLIACVKAA